MRRFPSPSRSSIGAFNHSLISRSTCPSAMRRATDLRRSSCGIESKEEATHYPPPGHPNSVTILRERHPFEGRSLQVMSTIKRRGVQLLLLALPDGSRSLIPAIWTDWKASKLSNEPLNASSEARQRCLAPLNDLLHTRLIVDALLSRCGPIREANPADHEGRCHATDPGVSRSLPSRFPRLPLRWRCASSPTI